MKLPLPLLRAIALSCAVSLFTLPAHSQSRTIASGGTTTPQAVAPGLNGVSDIEIDQATQGDDDDGNDAIGFAALNRQMTHGRQGHGDQTQGKSQREDHAALALSFDGLNLHDQRFANGGNQFTVEPPDQGLCAGAGFVIESVNDVLRIFDTQGNPLIGVVDLNTFYGYPAAINRTVSPLQFGPSITDPSCMFDRDTQRFFHLVLTLDRVNPGTQSLNGKNHLDLAVSNTSDPRGSWTIYRIPVQDDGTDGTPNHGCRGGACLGDFPHIGADANGVYLTTNEFNLFANGFHGAQIYALSKQQLVSGGPVTVFQFDTAATATATNPPGFAVMPATSAGENSEENHGTEFLLSSTAVFTDAGIDNHVRLWSFTNTRNLNNGQAPTLSDALVDTESYGIPSLARQPGSGTDGTGANPNGGNVDWPLGQCLNISGCSTGVLGVAFQRFGAEVIGRLAGDDSRMKQVTFANGKLFAALGTGISFDGVTFGADGVAYFILKPKVEKSGPTATVDNQGYVATPTADLTYPTIAATQNGKGVITFTLTGPSNFPSLAYVNVNPEHGAGDIHIAQAGAGVQDGFTEYKGETGSRNTRPRWGDYGAAAVDGDNIFNAQEYIGQSCSLTTWLADATCGNTRALLGNWGTRIARFSTDVDED